MLMFVQDTERAEGDELGCIYVVLTFDEVIRMGVNRGLTLPIERLFQAGVGRLDHREHIHITFAPPGMTEEAVMADIVSRLDTARTQIEVLHVEEPQPPTTPT